MPLPAYLLRMTSPPSFSGGIWTSGWLDCSAYKRVVLVLNMSQSSVADGVSLQFSQDNTNVVYSVSGTATANDGLKIVVDGVALPFVRVRINIGSGSAPTSFQLVVAGESE